MRDENRRLLIDIQLMTREIDVVNNGQSKIYNHYVLEVMFNYLV